MQSDRRNTSVENRNRWTKKRNVFLFSCFGSLYMWVVIQREQSERVRPNIKTKNKYTESYFLSFIIQKKNPAILSDKKRISQSIRTSNYIPFFPQFDEILYTCITNSRRDFFSHPQIIIIIIQIHLNFPWLVHSPSAKELERRNPTQDSSVFSSVCLKWNNNRRK